MRFSKSGALLALGLGMMAVITGCTDSGGLPGGFNPPPGNQGPLTLGQVTNGTTALPVTFSAGAAPTVGTVGTGPTVSPAVVTGLPGQTTTATVTVPAGTTQLFLTVPGQAGFYTITVPASQTATTVTIPFTVPTNNAPGNIAVFSAGAGGVNTPLTQVPLNSQCPANALTVAQSFGTFFQQNINPAGTSLVKGSEQTLFGSNLADVTTSPTVAVATNGSSVGGLTFGTSSLQGTNANGTFNLSGTSTISGTTTTAMGNLPAGSVVNLTVAPNVTNGVGSVNTTGTFTMNGQTFFIVETDQYTTNPRAVVQQATIYQGTNTSGPVVYQQSFTKAFNTATNSVTNTGTATMFGTNGQVVTGTQQANGTITFAPTAASTQFAGFTGNVVSDQSNNLSGTVMCQGSTLGTLVIPNGQAAVFTPATPTAGTRSRH